MTPLAKRLGYKLTVFTAHGIDLEDDAAMAREKARLHREFWPKLRRFAAQLPFAEDLLAAYFCAFDRNTPRRVQIALVGALAYFVLPFDFIPDMLPLVGFTDDAAVLATAVRLVAVHIGPRHREAARRVLARAAAPPSAAHGGKRAAGLGEGGAGAREFGASRG
jgi:uncharacterized membrane protein YkvA (DUF1232 family)